MSSYLLYEPNNILCAFIAVPKLQFHISNPRGKIVQNVKFLSVNENNDLTLKLKPTYQHESRGMLSFQNKTPGIKLLQFHVNRDNGLLDKYDFYRKLLFQN